MSHSSSNQEGRGFGTFSVTYRLVNSANLQWISSRPSWSLVFQFHSFECGSTLIVIIIDCDWRGSLSAALPTWRLSWLMAWEDGRCNPGVFGGMYGCMVIMQLRLKYAFSLGRYGELRGESVIEYI